MPLTIGEKAPDFTLYDSDKNKVTLSDHIGSPILLLFFPFAFSKGCTEELCSIRDNYELYNQSKSKVFGISVDSLYTLAKFKADQKLNFTLLSDFNKEVSSLYNALHETFSYEMKGVSKRATFVINKEGVVTYAEVLENAGLQPNFSLINKAIMEIT